MEERFEETHVFVAQVFTLPTNSYYSEMPAVYCDASGAVFEAEKVRLSEKLWFHRSCFTCKACRGFLDVLRCGDNEDGYDDGNVDDIVDESDSLLPTPPTTQVDHWSRWGGVL